MIDVRWRGKAGELDLIFKAGEVFVFTEVKKARNRDVAISYLRPAQMCRIHAAASEYLGHTPKGQLSEVRFDLAIMDSAGAVEIIENAFGYL